MSADRLLPRALVLASLLAAMWALQATGCSTLLAWTDRCFPVERYPALFAAFFATWLAGAALAPRFRIGALLAGSIACATIASPGFAVCSLLWVWVYHRVLFAPVRTRWKLAFAVGSMGALALACNQLVFPEALARHPFIAAWGYLFAVSYTFRTFWVLHQVHLRPHERVPLGAFALYFVFAPFFVIVPYMMAIPRCDRFCAGLSRHDVAVEVSGMRMIAWGIAMALLAAALPTIFDPRGELIDHLRARDLGAVLLIAPLFYPVQVCVEAIAIASMLVGMVRVLGIDLGPSFSRPLAATSVGEWWRRWNTHFRDFLVDLFYYPVLMRARRRRVLASLLGCAAVFLFGSTLFHIPKPYFRDGSHLAFPIGTLAESAVMCVLVALELVLEQRRGRAGGSVSVRGPLGTVARVVGTWYLVLTSVVFVGYSTTYAVAVRPREEVHAVIERARELVASGCMASAATLVDGELARLRWLARRFPRDPAVAADLTTAIDIHRTTHEAATPPRRNHACDER